MPKSSVARRSYWRSTQRISAALLGVWLLVTLGVCLFGPSLAFDFFGWPFSFWVASQGALVVYMVIIWFYARSMNRLDQEHGVAEEE